MIRIWCMSVWRLSVAYIEPKSRTQRHRKTKICTEVGHVTRDSDTTFKVKGQLVACGGVLWRPPAEHVFHYFNKEIIMHLPHTVGHYATMTVVCKSVCPVSDTKSRSEGRGKLKIDRKEAYDTGDPWPNSEAKRSRSMARRRSKFWHQLLPPSEYKIKITTVFYEIRLIILHCFILYKLIT